MTFSIEADTLKNLDIYWRKSGGLAWPCPFVLPPWLEAWWQIFGRDGEMFLRTVRQGGDIAGIAPLRREGTDAFFLGDVDVCDYLDFVVAPGREADFCHALLGDLVNNGVRRLDLRLVRLDSVAMRFLVPQATARGCRVDTAAEDVNVEMELPSAWEDYLESLGAKQRHEVRRKLRRLAEAGDLQFRFIGDGPSIPGAMDVFFRMFTDSRRDKAAFLTEKREVFFRALAAGMADAGLLRLGVLELDGKPVAQIICFDYNNCVYLYNSGYDPGYVSLSAGLLSKVLAIKDSIGKGRERFDFLKGAETYKYHLGGSEVPLYRCLIELK